MAGIESIGKRIAVMTAENVLSGDEERGRMWEQMLTTGSERRSESAAIGRNGETIGWASMGDARAV